MIYPLVKRELTMKTIKRCIFHYPYPISKNPSRGSELRPYMMLQAFENVGYEVFEITGYGEERKNKIRELKKRIREGVEYDFLYSESVTMPMLLSEKNHLPRYPFLDFSLFKFCRKYNIKIGLFYRDMYWKFPIYNKSVSFIKRVIAKAFYIYDLYEYKKWLSCMFVASLKIKEFGLKQFELKALPPGGAYSFNKIASRRNKQYPQKHINIFYAGGMTQINDISGLLRAVNLNEHIDATICTSEEELEKYIQLYGWEHCERINIVHKSSKELAPYYEEADIAALYFPDNLYRKAAMPIKLFEYISYGIPIISSSGNAAAEMIKNNNIGWVIDYDDKEIDNLFCYLLQHQNDIKEKAENVCNIAYNNSWESRAKQVCVELN